MDPPQCVQNAMMKQDKKPFTYTPGGLDLSEIRSPRMARRIERNANYEGAPEAPRQPSQPLGPLPPSALAAMQPQMHVQVFPSGPPPSGPRAGPPPPPPPPSANVPRPPPPPLEPMPTQKVTTNDNQVLERPDMTKIIPENPMALLRKTSGPQPRASFLDEVLSKPQQQRSPPVYQQQQQQRSPPVVQQQQQQSPPVLQQRSPPVWQQQQQQQRSPPIQQQQQQQNQRWSQVQPPPLVQQQPQQNNQWSPPSQPEPPRYQPKIIERNHQASPPIQPEPPRYQPKIIERTEEPVVKTSTAHLGSLYIPPINQQQQRVVTSPPPPPKRDSPQIQSPSTPTLKEAPRPWQKQQKQSEELPPWAKKEPVSPQEAAQQQPQRQPVQQASPNAVFVTQPVVLQHPGPSPNRHAQGAVVIPVQIERKAPAKPTTPGNERSLNRQQSWGNTPPQSNAFKVIQKITQTDGDDVDENAPITEHGPRYPQQFQQTPPAEQLRKLKLTEGDRDLMNRFRQEEEDPRYRGGLIPSRVFRILDESGVDDDTSLHNEVDPRYRGPAIPSKAFKLLQSMTDGSSDTTPSGTPAVSRGPPAGNRSPQVRNIPIQIERDDEPKNYVHPSQQTVPEPKKYTGSSIPSRSFKILQAMTAPDGCANANEVNENYDPSSYNQWGYDPNYPPPVPPYWPDYYYNYYYPNPNPKEQTESNDNRDIRQTPAPFWGYYPPPTPYPYMRPLRTPDVESSDNETGRNTPLPYWGYYPYYPETDEPKDAPPPPPTYQYPPYWDPYYGYSYYGYPPMYSPYPFYDQSESDDVAGYSSTDEMRHFSKKLKNQNSEQRDMCKTPQILVTPSIPETTEADSNCDSSETDSETEVETEEEQMSNSKGFNGLQAIRSVKDISVYDDSEEEPIVEECSEETEDNDDSVSYVEGDTIPHQLSVIFEVSETSDSRREASVLSDSTTIADRSDEEDDETSTAVSVKLPLQLQTQVNENTEVTTVTVGEITIEEDEDKSLKTLKQPAEEAGTDTKAVISSDDQNTIPNEDKKMNNFGVDEDEQDWWEILNKDDDVLPVRSKTFDCEPEPEVVAPTEEVDDDDDGASSTSSSDSSSGESSKKDEVEEEEVSSSDEETESEDGDNNAESVKEEPMSIKERIQALKDSINSKRVLLNDEEIKGSVKEKISAIESGNLLNASKTTSTKSSVKSFEEFSEEEGDSGVTSDMSRHISDNEEFPELRKMTRYQRAATHSRLFKLLQEVCESDEEEEDNKDVTAEPTQTKEETSMRRDQLSLPLGKSGDESFSSSGITSPGSPVNDRLVTELVQSILKRKKGQMFRNIPKEKLQAAAKRILQEEFDDLSTPDSSFLSPLRNDTETSSPAQTPQEFYNDYKQYYDSWKDAELLNDENYDILPSKAFKLLQEHSGSNRTGAIAGLLAKCPKILSSKNVHQELLRLMEESSDSHPSLEPSEVTSASCPDQSDL